MNTQIAIVYEKFEYGQTILIYKPIGVVEGKVEKNHDMEIFKTIYNEYYYLTNNPLNLNNNVKYAVGNVIEKEELIKTIGEKISLEEAMQIYIFTYMQKLNFALYIEDLDLLELAEVDLLTTYDNLYKLAMENEKQKEFEKYNDNYEKKLIGFLREGEKKSLEINKAKKKIGFISEENVTKKEKVKKNKIGFIH